MVVMRERGGAVRTSERSEGKGTHAYADVVTLHMYATELQFKLSAGIAS